LGTVGTDTGDGKDERFRPDMPAQAGYLVQQGLREGNLEVGIVKSVALGKRRLEILDPSRPALLVIAKPLAARLEVGDETGVVEGQAGTFGLDGAESNAAKGRKDNAIEVMTVVKLFQDVTDVLTQVRR
jgi:hypothetical protein